MLIYTLETNNHIIFDEYTINKQRNVDPHTQTLIHAKTNKHTTVDSHAGKQRLINARRGAAQHITVPREFGTDRHESRHLLAHLNTFERAHSLLHGLLARETQSDC